MTEWFKPWDRPEYQEWALEIEGGYQLVIIRKEKDAYLCARAKLLMREEGLPDFTLEDQLRVASEEEALKQIDAWKHEPEVSIS